MPLIQSKSKKAMSKNIATEMEHGKPRAQSIAIAYDVRRRNAGPKKKKMAEGGMINESARSERRPMPDERDHDTKMVSQNSSRKDNRESGWTDQPTVRQAQKPSITPLSRPRMAEGRYKVRDREDVRKEEMMMSEMPPASDKEQPDKEYDEMGAKRQGPRVSDMQDEHSTHRKPYAKGGEVDRSDEANRIREERNKRGRVNESVGPADKGINMPHDSEGESAAGADLRYGLKTAAKQGHKRVLEQLKRMPKAKFAKGGEVEASDYRSPINKYEDDLLDLNPSEDEGSQMAHSDDEEGQNRQGPAISDMEDEHSTGRRPYAGGGSIQYKDAMRNERHDQDLSHHDHPEIMDMNDEPEDEAEEEHYNSITAAIMAKEHRESMDSDSDIDRQMMMARGGYINGEDSIYTHEDEDQADLARNAEEDKNMEDQSSFDALRKENYNESEGLRQLDQPSDSNEHGDEIDSDDHDMIGKIRSKMRRRQFKAD